MLQHLPPEILLLVLERLTAEELCPVLATSKYMRRMALQARPADALVHVYDKEGLLAVAKAARAGSFRGSSLALDDFTAIPKRMRFLAPQIRRLQITLYARSRLSTPLDGLFYAAPSLSLHTLHLDFELSGNHGSLADFLVQQAPTLKVLTITTANAYFWSKIKHHLPASMERLESLALNASATPRPPLACVHCLVVKCPRLASFSITGLPLRSPASCPYRQSHPAATTATRLVTTTKVDDHLQRLFANARLVSTQKSLFTMARSLACMHTLILYKCNLDAARHPGPTWLTADKVPHLKVLRLQDCTLVPDIPTLPRLQELTVTRCCHALWVDANDLRVLVLTGSKVRDVHPRSLENCHTLKLAWCVASTHALLAMLLVARRLVHLSVEGTALATLMPLVGSRTLRSLDCSHTGIDDVGPLATCVQLARLTMHDMKAPLVSLAPLAGLPLTSLALAGTKAPDLHALAPVLPRLKRLVVDMHGLAADDSD